MIAHISGALAEIFGSSCIVITSSGVGYRVILPKHTLDSLPPRGDHVAFYTSMLVREDAQELYGFETFAERQAFDILRSISKIGPKAALSILSVYRPGDLQTIVREESIVALTKVPGIGAKTAQHLLLELRYKMQNVSTSVRPVAASHFPIQADVLAALTNLGYTDAECGAIVAQIFRDEPDLDVSGAVRLALKELAKGKKL